MPAQTLKSYDEVQIRIATSNDVEKIVAVQKSAPEAAQWPQSVYSAIFAPQSQDDTGLERKVLCATQAEIIIGFAVVAILVLRESSQCELENMAVASGWRRRGVGRRLVEAVLGCCPQQASRTILEVRMSNVGAIRLYESKGFTKIGVRGKYYSNPEDDAIQMEWTGGQDGRFSSC